MTQQKECMPGTNFTSQSGTPSYLWLMKNTTQEMASGRLTTPKKTRQMRSPTPSVPRALLRAASALERPRQFWGKGECGVILNGLALVQEQQSSHGPAQLQTRDGRPKRTCPGVDEGAGRGLLCAEPGEAAVCRAEKGEHCDHGHGRVPPGEVDEGLSKFIAVAGLRTEIQRQNGELAVGREEGGTEG